MPLSCPGFAHKPSHCKDDPISNRQTATAYLLELPEACFRCAAQVGDVVFHWLSCRNVPFQPRTQPYARPPSISSFGERCTGHESSGTSNRVLTCLIHYASVVIFRLVT